MRHTSILQNGRGVQVLELLFFVLAFCTVGCSSADEPVAAGGNGEILAGTVRAYASSSPTPISPAGILVSILGTSFQASADTAGHFEIHDIPAGVYSIIFSKPGFDSMIYPVHHLIGVGTDIINDAYLIEESRDSIAIKSISAVFKITTRTRTFTITDSIFHDSLGYAILDSVIRRDSTIEYYDTVQNASALTVTSNLIGTSPPGDVFVYSSLDSTMWPFAGAPQNASVSEDEWLTQHLTDTAYRTAVQSPHITANSFAVTLAKDARTLSPYSLGPGQPVYIFVVGHSNTNGLPVIGGEYQHYRTTPFGPRAMRFTYIVP